MMTFGEELKIFSSKYPYQEVQIDGVPIRDTRKNTFIPWGW